ncbi:MAG: DegV family EDD domain-containing protein [Ruminococcaceae bacterium]|nr:DegV family EDD domain-containing protein [Oscillospiraceae bacterium]
MNFKIVSDSSSNILSFAGVPYTAVPLKIITNEREYVDDATLDVAGMVKDLRTVKGRTGTSCPNIYEWKTAMADADAVFAITMTSNLSGTHAAALQAKAELLAECPEKKICVLDSLSTGPEMQLVIEKLAALISSGKSFEAIECEIREYMTHTHLIFCLESLTNLARNGRVNPVVAKVAGVLGIRVVGVASEQGTLELLHKPRGGEKALSCILDVMKRYGYRGGAVRLAHCNNEVSATKLAAKIRAIYPAAEIKIIPTTALCSFYAEEGGLMIGYEDIK